VSGDTARTFGQSRGVVRPLRANLAAYHRAVCTVFRRCPAVRATGGWPSPAHSDQENGGNADHEHFDGMVGDQADELTGRAVSPLKFGPVVKGCRQVRHGEPDGLDILGRSYPTSESRSDLPPSVLAGGRRVVTLCGRRPVPVGILIANVSGQSGSLS
jgi:hypothetical protein